MINVISDINPKKRFRQSFCNTQNSAQQPLNYADKFLSELEKTNKKEQNGSFFTKYFWSTTALCLSAIPVLGYELGAFFKIRKMKKDGLKIEVDTLKKSFKSKFKYVLLGGIALFAGLEALFNSFNEKNYKKLALVYHPDKNAGSKEAEEIFKSITDAYHTLIKSLRDNN